jgi:hypothetical protein
MRNLLSGFAVLSLLAVQQAEAQLQCLKPQERTAIQIAALRSQLMVLATGCHDDEKYNAFMRRYQADLQANERSINAYFQHRYGKAAQVEHDRFVTDLANAISRQGSDLGGDFCPRNGLIFNEVLALESAAQLTEFAAGKNLVPGSVEICTPMPSSATAARKMTSKKK